MSSIEFRKIGGKNFHSFEEFLLPIIPGKHLIVGDNRSSGSATSNGSGKSTIMESIPWTLYKTSTRGKDPSRNYDGNCMTFVEFAEGGHLYRVQRYWKDKDFKNDIEIWKDGENLSLRKKGSTESEIQKIISYSYDLFTSAVVVLQGLPMNFTSLTPTVCKSMIEDMIKFSVWDEYGKKFRGVHSEIELDRRQKDILFQELRLKMTGLNAQLETLKKSKDQAKEEFQSQIKEVETKIQELNNSLSVADKKLLEVKKELNEHPASGNLSTQLYQAQTRFQTLRKIVESKMCPECEQHYPELRIKSATQELEKIHETIEFSKNALKMAQYWENEYKQADWDFRSLDSVRQSFKSQLSSLLQRMNQQEVKHDLAGMDEELKGYITDVNGLKRELDSVGRKLEDLGYLRDLMLPSSKFRTDVLEKYIGYINQMIESIVPLIFDEMQMKLVVTSRGDGIEVDIKRRGKSIDYKSLSGGERKRMDIAVILSFQRFLIEAAGVSTNLVVLDEIFDALDVRGIENVMACLDSLFPDTTAVYIITHNDSLKSTFNSVVKVVKESDISRIEGFTSEI